MLMVLKNIIILLSRLNRASTEPVEGSPEPVEGSLSPSKGQHNPKKPVF